MFSSCSKNRSFQQGEFVSIATQAVDLSLQISRDRIAVYPLILDSGVTLLGVNNEEVYFAI